MVRADEQGGRVFVSINDIVAALGGTLTYDDKTRSYDVKLKQRAAVFGLETAIVVVDTRLVTLSGLVRGDGPSAYAEPEFFQKVIGPMVGTTFAWEKTGRTLTAHRTETADIAVEASVADIESTTKIVFRFSQPPTYRVDKGDDQVVIRVTGARLTTSQAERPVDGPRVSRLIIHPGEVAVVLRERGLSTNVYPLGNPPRVVVDVTRAAPAALLPTPAPGTTPAPSLTPAMPEREQKTIVLDPGHGGTEEGAKGPGGLLEKEATLGLVKTIRETLVKKGYRVVTTRDTDASVGLDDRAAQANAAKADVFLSIHCNASRAASAHGTEVYYLSLDASDRAAAAVAEKENRSGDATPTPSAETNAALRDLDLILWDLAQNQHLSASSRLAEIIQRDFNQLLGITTRGVKQAPFKVLIGVNATAVLVEVAFITNPEEEKKLGSEEFRQQVADTLAGSLELYFKAADGVAPAPFAPSPAIGRR